MTSRTICALLCSAALLRRHAASVLQRRRATSPNTKLMSARALYYTPTAQGLKSFRCTVDFDWKDFLTRYSGADVKDDNPFLQYLRTVHLAIADDLNGDGKLEWTTSSATPGRQGGRRRQDEGRHAADDGRLLLLVERLHERQHGARAGLHHHRYRQRRRLPPARRLRRHRGHRALRQEPAPHRSPRRAAHQ